MRRVTSALGVRFDYDDSGYPGDGMLNLAGNEVAFGEIPTITSQEIIKRLGSSANLLTCLSLGGEKIDLIQRDNHYFVGAEGGNLLFEVPSGVNTKVGRGADNDIVLSNRRVSRRHLSFWVANDSDGPVAQFHDYCSLNGTWPFIPLGGVKNEIIDWSEMLLQCGVSEVSVKGDDRYVSVPLRGVFGVFDGVGGHEGGAIAAERAAMHAKSMTNLAGHRSAFTEESVENAENWVISTLNGASRKISNMNQGATTGTLCRVVGGADRRFVAWASVGDSRLYVIRQGKAYHISQDEGVGNQITNWLGRGGSVVAQYGNFELLSGDRLVLVTDGVTGGWGEDAMTDQELANIVSSQHNTQVAADMLVSLARKIDDRTAIVVGAA